MKAILIDDSLLARQELRHLLRTHPEVEVLGEAEDATQALQLIEESKPDLLFLDIHMPGKDGFELLTELEQVPEVIFTTAYDQYAIKAFEYNALDYLQKPIREDRLAAAIEKAGEKLTSRESAGRKLLGPQDQVFVKQEDRCWFVQLADVRLLEADGGYARIFFGEERPSISRSLNYLEKRLDPAVFFRANRQQIINLSYVDRIEPWFSGTLKVYLKGGEAVEISRRQSAHFRDRMSF